MAFHPARYNRAKQRKARVDDLRSVPQFVSYLDELSSRLEAIAHHQAREAGLDPKEEVAKRKALRKGLALMALERLDVGPLEGAEQPAEAVKVKDSRWRSFTLLQRHQDAHGARSCPKCGAPAVVGEKVWYQKSNPTELVHHRCHKPGSTSRGAWKIYELTERHVLKHGPANCIGCGLPAKIGSKVAWKIGLKGVYHEGCLKEEK